MPNNEKPGVLNKILRLLVNLGIDILTLVLIFILTVIVMNLLLEYVPGSLNFLSSVHPLLMGVVVLFISLLVFIPVKIIITLLTKNKKSNSQ